MKAIKKIPRGGGGQQGGAAAGGFPADLARAARDLATSVSFMPAGATGIVPQAGVGGGQGFDAMIDLQLRAVLGRVPTGGANFVQALDRSFEIYDEEGHNAWRLTDRGGVAGMTDFGISGALPAVQAIVAQKGQETLATVGPILKRLAVLNRHADEEEIDAVRSNLQTEFENLVEELGREQGIRKERADLLFTNILGDPRNNEQNKVDPDSLFGIFATKAGYAYNGELDDRHVTTLNEEQHLADMVVMRGALRSFWQSYRNYRSSGKLFFSDELFTLSRALLAIQETTQAVEHALDTVGLGESRRQMLLSDKKRSSSMKLQDLLDWASDFAAEEAPQILERGGRFGLKRLKATLGKFGTIIGDVDISDPAFNHPRVQRAWDAFQGAVRDAAASIPTVTGRGRAKKKGAKK